MSLLDIPGISNAQAETRYSRNNLFLGLPVVASRSNGFNVVNGLSNGTDLSATARTLHMITTNCMEIRLVFANFYHDSASTSQPGPNPVTIKVNVDPVLAAPQSSTSSGNNYPVTFRGLRSATVEPGGILISDPLPFSGVAGQYLAIRTFKSVASAGMKWPTTMTVFTANQEGYSAGVDATATNAAISGGNGARVYSPIAIIGTPTSSIIPVTEIGIGDSITYGTGDNLADGLGFFVRYCNAVNRSYLNLSKPGEKAGDFAGTYFGTVGNNYYRIPIAMCGSRATVLYGTNDTAAGRTLVEWQTSLIAIWSMFSLRKIPVYAGTIPPRTTSTDGWATLGNQVLQSLESIRTSGNDWIRDGAPILAGAPVATGSNAAGTLRFGDVGHPGKGYHDFADACESSRNSGLWKISTIRTTTSAISTGTNVLTAAGGNFVAGDKGRAVRVIGAGASGADLLTYIAGVTNSTTVSLGTNASTTITAIAPNINIGVPTSDGVHPSMDLALLMQAVIQARFP